MKLVSRDHNSQDSKIYQVSTKRFSLQQLLKFVGAIIPWTSAKMEDCLLLERRYDRLTPWTNLLPFLLVTSLVPYGLEQPLTAQTTPSRIDVVVVGGEAGVNGLLQRVTQDPAVRIEDQDHQPISGAVVTFNLPISSTSGEFANGSKNTSIVTGADGLAVARGLRTNETPGRFQILITASYRGLSARGLINQTNQGTPGTKAHSSGKIIVILAVVGAAAAGGALAATRKGANTSATSGPPPPAPIGITPGTGAITHP